MYVCVFWNNLFSESQAAVRILVPRYWAPGLFISSKDVWINSQYDSTFELYGKLWYSEELQIWSRLEVKRTVCLLKFQRSMLCNLIGVLTAHRIMNTNEKRMELRNLANAFCISFRDKKVETTILHLLGTSPALCIKRKRHVGAYYLRDICELPGGDMGNLNRFILNSGKFILGKGDLFFGITMGLTGIKIDLV